MFKTLAERIYRATNGVLGNPPSAAQPHNASRAVVPSRPSSGSQNNVQRQWLPRDLMQPIRHPVSPRPVKDEHLVSAAKKSALRCMSLPASSISATDVAELQKFLTEHFLARMNAAGCDGQSLATYLGEVDQLYREVESAQGQEMDPDRFAANRKVVSLAFDRSDGKLLELVDAYQHLPDFEGKNDIFIGLAKRRLTKDIAEQFPDVDANNAGRVKRLTGRALNHVTQGEYILHVSHLFNLEHVVTRDDMNWLLGQLRPESRDWLQKLQRRGQTFVGTRFKDAVPFLLNCLPSKGAASDKASRNTHPASLLLQRCSGFVFHPKYDNMALLDHRSPYAFENMAGTLARKYFEAKHYGKLPEFFAQAFAPQNACYEAVAECLMNYSPAPSGQHEVVFHPRPMWDDASTVNDNLNGMLAWVQREMLKEFASEKSMNVTVLTLDDINRLESSKPYMSWLVANEALVTQRLGEASSHRVPEAELAAFVHDDLMLGATVS